MSQLWETASTIVKAQVKRFIPTDQSSVKSLIDFSRLVLFSMMSKEKPILQSRSDLDIRRMTPEGLLLLTQGCGRFADQARKYYVQRGIDTAYGAYRSQELVHMSWVYTDVEYSKEPFRRLALKNREVEIVNCFTLEKCRGLGIFPYVIQWLLNEQFENGVERVYMMAHHNNQASQHGIMRAGLKRVGRVIYMRIPASSSKSIFYHRSQSTHTSSE